MTTTVGPITLAGAGQTLTLTSPIQANVSQQWWAILTNSSDYILQVTTDHGTHFIHPYVADMVTGRSNPPTLVVTTVVNPGGTIATQGTDSVTVAWGIHGESVASSYPLALAGIASPLTVFNQQAIIIATANVSNQVLVPAPATAGASIYLQTLSAGAVAIAAATFVRWHAVGQNMLAFQVLNTPAGSDWVTFPGGYQLPAGASLMVDIGASQLTVTATYGIQ